MGNERSISDLATPAAAGAEFRVRGLVQGVGFRPAVWHLANRFGLTGEVWNDSAGVLIRAWGPERALAALETALLREPPPLARIEGISRTPIFTASPIDEFRIVASLGGSVSTGIVPDAATCPACLAEILDPNNRRYRYPFTNCTHCGPRLSIIRAIPYDRKTTSMSAFPMCAKCRAEYENPTDRRFHAEPIACPTCGPRVWLEGEPPTDPATDAIEAAARQIRNGEIVAIKGIGGFHLACDAANETAVSRLRQRKRRYHKPFALMARDVEMIRTYVSLHESDAAALAFPAAPIVVLDQRPGAPSLARELAPGQRTLGFMLPYTPLHHLLMRHLDGPIVLTSGNASDEPQCIDNADAREKLAGIADHWLMHDRDIVNRLDDSVVRGAGPNSTVLRRARGLAPEPIPMPDGFEGGPRVLALGAELKSTFCLLAEGRAIVSQHIGDLEDAATHADFRKALALYREIFSFDPGLIAIDMHPDYLSSQWGHALAAETGARLVSIQHHHAHVAAVLAEHRVPPSAPPVLGIVLDGLGLGGNGELWGGEFIRATYHGFTRLAAFQPAPLVGGQRAMREPWRNAFAHLNDAFSWREVTAKYPDLAIVRLIETKQPALLSRMVASGLNAPPASSAGRLFDAAAAIIGIHPEAVSYEGQAAIELEALAAASMDEAGAGYPSAILDGDPIRLTWHPFWQALLSDVEGGTPPAIMAARIHRGLIDATGALAGQLCVSHKIDTVVLSGGVFQNTLLRDGMAHHLTSIGLDVLMPRRVPANDGGLSLGQAALAAAKAGPAR